MTKHEEHREQRAAAMPSREEITGCRWVADDRVLVRLQSLDATRVPSIIWSQVVAYLRAGGEVGVSDTVVDRLRSEGTPVAGDDARIEHEGVVFHIRQRERMQTVEAAQP